MLEAPSYISPLRSQPLHGVSFVFLAEMLFKVRDMAEEDLHTTVFGRLVTDCFLPWSDRVLAREKATAVVRTPCTAS